MNSFQSQHRHTLASGVVIERLSLGFAAGRWWASFVAATPDRGDHQPPIDQRIAVSSTFAYDPDGHLDCVGGTGGGDERECSQTWELVDHGATQARVSYTQDDVEVGSELLTLDPTDRAGCFAVRLTDGSLVERLPVGHAHGRWRLQWVRSDVPSAEAELVDGRIHNMPHQRFVRLRSTVGPLDLLDASGVLGGAVQPFSVRLPDTLSHLEVDYVVEDEVVATEIVPLPERRT